MAEVKAEHRMEKLETVTNGTMDLGHQLDELIAYKRETLKTIQSAVISEQSTLINTRQEIERIQRDAKYAQQVEMGKFKDSLQVEKDVI